jgi:hypothetical protein
VRDSQRVSALRRICPGIAIAVLAWIFVACSPMMTEAPETEPGAPEPTTISEPTSLPEPLPTATRPPVVVEADETAPAGDALGQLEFEYPIRMEPLASDTAILELSIPELLAASEPVGVARVEAQSSAPPEADLGRYDAVVFVAGRMRAELASPALKIAPLHPAAQDVVLTEIDHPTVWAWTLQAPETPGKQVMTLSLSREGDDVPVWVGSFRVDVASVAAGVETSPQPTPTLTPAPLVRQLVDAVTQDLTTVVMGVVGLVGTIVAAIIAARIERGGSRRSRGTPTSRQASGTPYHGGWLRSLWFRLRERRSSRKRH